VVPDQVCQLDGSTGGTDGEGWSETDTFTAPPMEA